MPPTPPISTVSARRSGLVLASLAALGLAACGSSTPTATHTATPAPASLAATTPTPAPTPTPVPTPPPLNAPAVVQVENLPDARPLSGIGSADILYEYATEGGITRFSAIFFNGVKGALGPVRSARLVSPEITQLYHGFLVYSGASNYTNGRLAQSGVKRYNETSGAGALFRIGSRAAPHNLYTDTARLAQLVARAAMPAVSYSLWARGGAVTAGKPGSTFTVPLSNWERPTYTWNAGAGGYVRTDTTGTFIDANTSRPIVAPTVVVMQVPAHINPQDVEDVSGAAGWEYTLTGSGPAQIFTGGQEQDGSWTQPDAGGPPQLTVAGGAPAAVAPGLVWICLVPTGSPAAFH